MSAHAAPRETLNLGEIQVTYLPDGEASVSASALFPASTQELWDAHRDLFDADDRLLMTLGSFLIRTGGRTILVDLGFGDHTVAFPAADGEFRSGRLLTSLREEGLTPQDVDTVFYTHMHIDHVGWTAQDGALTFNRARHLVGEGELEYWRSPDNPLDAVGPDPENVLAPLTERVDSVADGTTIAPGVTVVATPGHTPGHCSLVLSSGQERALLLGDAIHCPAQLTENEVSLAFDTDPVLAARTRDRIFAEIEGDPRAIAAQGHFTGSVFGWILRGQSRRTWTTFSPGAAS
ncbi:MBL fold metallo-hydrolase [Saccharopolyspora tripterygii]